MIKAVLLDLDNTLLINPDAAFASAYLQTIEEFFIARAQKAGATRIIRDMLTIFNTSRNGVASNWDVALKLFTTAFDMSAQAFTELSHAFYTDAYPALVGCTQPVAGAADLIHLLRAKEVTVVIATNPIYPAEAIHQRMAWAGLPSDLKTYALVTTAENMHFSKPDAAYYAEIIARIGLEPDEVLVVGDSLRNDIHPARTLGVRTFHINPEGDSPADATGTLADFSALVAADGLAVQFTDQQLQPAMIDPQYRGNIGALYGLLALVQPDFWNMHPDPNEWSIVQILCHLRDAEEEHQRPRLERILTESNPFIVAPRDPGPNLPVCGADGMAIAADFVQARQQTLEFIHTLQPADWERRARHSIFGLTTLLEMAQFTAQHDRLHLNQLCQTIGRCH